MAKPFCLNCSGMGSAVAPLEKRAATAHKSEMDFEFINIRNWCGRIALAAGGSVKTKTAWRARWNWIWILPDLPRNSASQNENEKQTRRDESQQRTVLLVASRGWRRARR